MSNQLVLDVSRPAVDLSQPLLTAMDAAGLLSVRVSWVYDAARNGDLPCVRVGKHVRFVREDLERWAAAHRSG